MCSVCSNRIGDFFLFSKTHRAVLGPTQSATGGLPGALLEGHSGWNVQLTSPTQIKVKNEWRCTFTSPLPSFRAQRHSFTSQRLWVESGRLPLRIGTRTPTISSDIFFSSKLGVVPNVTSQQPPPTSLLFHYSLLSVERVLIFSEI